MPITLRPSTSSDIPAMYHLDLLCFEPPFRFDLDSMHHFANQTKSISLLAEDEAILAGFVIVNRRRSSAYVTTLDVHPDYRRQGLAHQLMTAAETAALQAGATQLRLHVSTENEAAIAFYASRAYQRVLLTEDFYARSLHAWLYFKPLAQS